MPNLELPSWLYHATREPVIVYKQPELAQMWELGYRDSKKSAELVVPEPEEPDIESIIEKQLLEGQEATPKKPKKSKNQE